MLPKADSSSFVLFSLLFVLTLTDPPRTGERIYLWRCVVCLLTNTALPPPGDTEAPAGGGKQRVRRKGLFHKPGTPVGSETAAG